MDRATRIVLWCIGIGFGLMIVGYVLVAVLGERSREMASYCTRCGTAQYRIYYNLDLFGTRWKFPGGIDAVGGSNTCPHQIVHVKPPIY